MLIKNIIAPDPSTISYGHCHCGCGEKAPALRDGSPARFIRKHAMKFNIEERFWRRVRKEPGDSCWEWQGNIQSNGYGRYGQDLAHRISYELSHGEIPDGLWVLHHCDNRKCCRPDHLYIGTVQDNTRDMIARNPHESLVKNKFTIGEKNGLAKLTEQDVRDIREAYSAGGITLGTLAKMYDVTPSAIHSAIRFYTWAHVN